MPRKIAKLKPHFVLDRVFDELIEADLFRGREMAWAMAQRVDRLSVNMMGYVRLKDLLRPTIIRPIRQLKRVRNRIVATVARRGEALCLRTQSTTPVQYAVVRSTDGLVMALPRRG